MKEVVLVSGNEGVAEAMRQINPPVVAAYPITPTTPLMETFSQFVADGLVDTEMILAESEHSAMSACIGAAAAGGRVMTATSGPGLAYMWEMLYIASGFRLPIVLVCGNRTLSGPLNIHQEHSDSMGCRDTGWIQIYSENVQEAYDNTIQAIRIAEHPQVLTPVMVCMDGFQTTHALDQLMLEKDEDVRAFIGEYVPLYPLLNVDNPICYGAADMPEYFFEHKRQQIEGIENSLSVIKKIGEEFGQWSGRDYSFFESYRLEDAEDALVVLNSTAGTCKDVIDGLRGIGKKVGLLKLRVFRPFPASEIAKALSHLKRVAILDRTSPQGALGGPLFMEIRSALYDFAQKPLILDYIYGLGGRDLQPYHIEEVFLRMKRIEKGEEEKGSLVSYLNLRE